MKDAEAVLRQWVDQVKDQWSRIVSITTRRESWPPPPIGVAIPTDYLEFSGMRAIVHGASPHVNDLERALGEIQMWASEHLERDANQAVIEACTELRQDFDKVEEILPQIVPFLE